MVIMDEKEAMAKDLKFSAVNELMLNTNNNSDGDYSLRYYILDENHNPIPADLLPWAEWLGNSAYRRVALTNVGDKQVSTVFLGLDQRFGGEGPPILFETMVFDSNNNYSDLHRARYSYWDEAVLGHARVVAALEAGTLELDQ